MAFLGDVVRLLRLTVSVRAKFHYGVSRDLDDHHDRRAFQDREFRMRYNERYESNRMFRRFFVYLTLWWLLGVCLYIGCVSAVIWTLPFHYAFGLSLGVLFSYIAVWAVVTYVWTTIEMKREHRAYEDRINV